MGVNTRAERLKNVFSQKINESEASEGTAAEENSHLVTGQEAGRAQQGCARLHLRARAGEQGETSVEDWALNTDEVRP